MSVKQTRPRGSIKPVGKDKYRIRICVGRNGVTGNYEYFDQTVSGKKKDAERVRAGVLRDLDLGQYSPPEQKTLNQWLDEWLAAQRAKVTPRTADGYAKLFEYYLREPLGKKSLPSLKPADIQAVYNDLATRLAPTTIRHLHAAFKAALRRAFQLGLIARNPAEPVEAPRIKNTIRPVLNPDEAAKFLEACDVMPRGLIFEFALLTGMRPEEYLALRWSDLDFTRRTATIKRVLVHHARSVSFEPTKTPKSARAIPLPPPLIAKLRAHKRQQSEAKLKAGPLWENHDLAFCGELGEPLRIPNLTYRYFRPILKKAELRQIRLYDLRHTHATLLLIEGEHLKVVSERLGHSSIKITGDVYSHVQPGMQERATDTLERLLYGKKSAG